MKKVDLITTGLLSATILFAVTSSHAQTSTNTKKETFNDASGSTSSATTKKVLNAPVVGEATSWETGKASRNENVSVHVFHNKGDVIDGARYAKGFANGFASREKTGDKPIYITANSSELQSDKATFVKIYMNGMPWNYEGRKEFTPREAGMLLPIIMNDYVKQFGEQNLIPDNQEPSLH